MYYQKESLLKHMTNKSVEQILKELKALADSWTDEADNSEHNPYYKTVLRRCKKDVYDFISKNIKDIRDID